MRNAQSPQPLQHGLTIYDVNIEAHQQVARRRTRSRGGHASQRKQLALQPIGADAAPPRQMDAQPAASLVDHPKLRSR